MRESCDTSVLFYALNPLSSEHGAASHYLRKRRDDREFLLCELMLIELYVLLRNPALNRRVPTAKEAVAAIDELRFRWQVIDYPGGLMSQVWAMAATDSMPRRRIFDIRLALTLRYYGVRRFATRNVQDFQGLGFDEVFDPIS